MTSKEIIATFDRAAAANRADTCRQGNLIRINAPAEIVMTGDLHSNQRNLERLIRYADLAHHPNRHLILHEIIHCHESPDPDQCHSYLVLAQAAQLKIDFPNQVHFLLGNHAMAQVAGDEILKAGKPMVRALNRGIEAAFAGNASLVRQHLEDFILSFPIAARSQNRVWMSHSLPSARHLPDFDDAVFDQSLTIDDMKNNPTLRALAWDRSHSAVCLEQLRARWDVDNFIIGHQPQEQGYHNPTDCLIILASDHPHGCFLPFDLKKDYDSDELVAKIEPLASIA